MLFRCLLLAALGLAATLTTAGAQEPASSVATPPPIGAPSPLPPAGIIPAQLSLDVTGSPVADPAFLDEQIREALNRVIRPTLQPGASVTYGPIVPWPLLPLPAGTRAAVNVTVTLGGDPANAPVSAVTMVVLNSVAVAPAPPRVLFLSDDPEYLLSDGLVLRGTVSAGRPTRLYYYHSDLGLPRDLDVVLTANAPARVRLIASRGGPDLDVMAVGHTVTRDLLRFEQQEEGIVVSVVPGRPFVVRHALLLQSEVAAGAVDVQVVAGEAVTLSVLASPAGSRPDAYLHAPRVAYDGHHRHGTFALEEYGQVAQTYAVGGPPVMTRYGARAPTPRNLDPNDDGRDYGDYGVVHHITFSLANPTDTPQTVYLYERPLGGPVRSSFLVDGQFREVGCVRLPQPYLVTSYQLAPNAAGASTTVTMTDGGSFYPLEFGVTDAPPSPYAPAVGSPDGCSPNTPAFPDPGNG
ncbi:MAG: hypothetical protein JOZ24_01735, partial [Candidatus Eremiobacteraeota bacterium]|nr:hypothetical protein [Candidatus Eremiobacteraeota bacterium]